ncbi:hypothetical protein AVEN_107911-1, partial [Araneus ventricosus]
CTINTGYDTNEVEEIPIASNGIVDSINIGYDTNEVEEIPVATEEIPAKKPVKIVIKGLPIDYLIEDIKNNLTKLNYRVDKVNQLKRFKDKKLLNIFQVHLFQSENIQEIYKLTTMEYYIIYVEKYVRKTVGQCFCCQKFAHHSSGCKMEARCVLCGEAHDSRVCPMKNKENFTPKCANCGGPHTASFRGCPNFPKLKITTPGQSYAAALKGNNKIPTNTERPPTTAGNQKNPTINLNNDITQEIPNPNEINDLFQLLKQVKKIMDQISNIKEVLKKMENTESITTKLFILAEALPQD